MARPTRTTGSKAASTSKKASASRSSKATPSKPTPTAAATTTTTTQKRRRRPKKAAAASAAAQRQQHDAARRKAYRRKQRTKQLAALQAVLSTNSNVDGGADDVQKQLRSAVWYRKGTGAQLAVLEKLIVAQQQEIRALKGGAQPRLGSDVDAEGEDDVVMMEGVVQSVEDGNGEEVKETIERDEGASTKERGEVEQNVVEKTEEAALATPVDTPVKGKKGEEVRGSSADSNAGTPRNVRRSPRKRTVKRRSFAGHSYAV